MKYFYTFILSLFLFLILPQIALADTKVAELSAQTYKAEEKPDPYDIRPAVLKSFLKRKDSPLSDYSESIVQSADKYNIPWTWVISISGVESNFGKAIPSNSYNAWGWANGDYSFTSWNDGIEIVSKTLKQNYIARGADTIDKIAPIYAPPSNTWSGKVHYFINELESSTSPGYSALSISL